jgi:hypothetical protein
MSLNMENEAEEDDKTAWLFPFGVHEFFHNQGQKALEKRITWSDRPLTPSNGNRACTGG